MKKSISVILVLAMALSLALGFGVPAVAEDGRNCTTDVVIVGAGGAGMVAALQAAQDGAKVILVEKTEMTGGNTTRSTGGMNAVGTEEQQMNSFSEAAGVEATLASAKAAYGEELKKLAAAVEAQKSAYERDPDAYFSAAETFALRTYAEELGGLIATVEAQWNAYQENPVGYFDSVELFVLDTMVGGKGLNNIDLVTTLAENSAAGVEWLKTIGADLVSVGAFGGASVKRIHRPVNEEGKTISVGAFLVPIFTASVEGNGDIELRYETEATHVIVEDGTAVGIVVKDEEGEYCIYANSVILATGGFGANLDMIVSLRPDLEGFVSTNAPGATGDGIVMAEEAGASIIDLDQIQIHPTVVTSTGALITEGLRGDGAILVNQEGERFCDEVGTRDVVSAAVIAQTGGYAYLIVDQKMVDASSVIAGYISAGYTVQGDTYEALAAEMGCDPATLAETMEAWNEAVAAGADEAFGRTSFARALDEGPFYAIKIAPGIHHCMGGIEINTNAEVLNTEGKVIDGLFAAGEVTGGVHGANRLGGNAVCDIVVYGRIAGTNAAVYAARK